ncbi:MAG TPA: hypothetical protein VK939_01135 [Longimicrobiales bacterium]|nr:hypothetical protein [Longimicrobiales bacterium]
MRTLRVPALLVAATVVLALPACATTGTAGDGTSFSVPIEVDNNLLTFGGVTVYVSRSSGLARRLLGPVEGGQKRTFPYDAQTGTFVLTARQAGAADLVSEQFQLQPGARVSWTLAQNRVLVSVN